MSPEQGIANSEGVKKAEGFLGSTKMKIWAELGGLGGKSIAAAVRDEHTIVREGRQLLIDGIDVVTPATMQKNKRRASSEFPVMNLNRALRQWRVLNGDKWHCYPPADFESSVTSA